VLKKSETHPFTLSDGGDEGGRDLYPKRGVLVLLVRKKKKFKVLGGKTRNEIEYHLDETKGEMRSQ